MASLLLTLVRSRAVTSSASLCRRLTLGNKAMGPVQNVMFDKLERSFKPLHLEIINESHKHNVPKGSETHFKVVIVSENFKDKMLVKRHQMVYSALKDEIDGGVHALSIVAKTPDQWMSCDQKVDPSPPCLGGSKR